MKKILFSIAVCSIIAVSCKKDKKQTEKEVEEVVSVEVKKIKLALEPKSNSNVSGSVVFAKLFLRLVKAKALNSSLKNAEC